MDTKKIIGIGAIIVILTAFTIMSMNKLKLEYFWIIVVIVAVYTYFIMPKLKSKSS